MAIILRFGLLPVCILLRVGKYLHSVWSRGGRFHPKLRPELAQTSLISVQLPFHSVEIVSPVIKPCTWVLLVESLFSYLIRNIREANSHVGYSLSIVVPTISKMYPKSLQNVSKNYPNTKMSPKCLQNVSKKYPKPKCLQKLSNFFPKTIQRVS